MTNPAPNAPTPNPESNGDLDLVESGALASFASLSSISSHLGVRSLGGAMGGAVAFPVSLVASSFAVSLGLMMACLVFSMLRSIRPAKLVAYTAIACLAAIFDAGFYSDVFVPKRWQETQEAREQEALAQESARLSTAAAGIRRSLLDELDAARQIAAARRARAEADYRYETEMRERLRGCGPLCKKAIRERAVAETELEGLSRLLGQVQGMTSMPSETSWAGLRSFYVELLANVSAIPSDAPLVLPGPPVEPVELSETGALLSKGGLVRILDQAASGEFSDPTLFIPLGLGVATEALGLLLVIALRRRRSLGNRIGGGLSGLNSFVGHVPSPALVAKAWRRWLQGKPVEPSGGEG